MSKNDFSYTDSEINALWRALRERRDMRHFVPAAEAAALPEVFLKVAEAKRPELVVVNVPHAYRNNHHRFLIVARQVPVLPVAADSPARKPSAARR